MSKLGIEFSLAEMATAVSVSVFLSFGGVAVDGECEAGPLTCEFMN